MLILLSKKFDINVQDKRHTTPLQLAMFQDSGSMRDTLLDLGVAEIEETGMLRRDPTSIIASVMWPGQEVDFKADAKEFLV